MAYVPLPDDEGDHKSTITTRQPVASSSARFSRRNLSRTGAHGYRTCHLSFKVVLAGEVDVGKTTLFNRLKAEAEDPSLGGLTTSSGSAHTRSGNLRRTGRQASNVHVQTQTEYRVPLQLNNGELAEITLVDTAGEERFNQTLTGSHYRNADLVLFVFDVSNELSLHALKHWVQQSRAGAVHRDGYLIGNKVDTRDTMGAECVPNASVCEFADAMGLTVATETCALTGQGVDSLLQRLAAHFTSSSRSGSIRSAGADSATRRPLALCPCCSIM